MVEYDEKAFPKAWDYLAAPTSDDEDPPKRVKTRPFLGRLIFSGLSCRRQGVACKTKMKFNSPNAGDQKSGAYGVGHR